MHRSRNPLAPRRLAALAIAGLLAAAGAAPALGAKRSVPTITISGTVYTFDNQVPIAGATVRVDELPWLSATSRADGSYELVIPGGTRFTPYSEAPGHARIYLQTFVSQGRDLGGVNFQMPTDGVYDLLANLLSVPRNPDGQIVDCAVVSTFSTINVRGVSFPEFVDYGAHGVANATATASPTLPKPVYFNEAVIPDPSRTSSSVDGGVIWPIVPAGVHRFFAHHPTTRFAPFRATCEPGRVVNANPTQGFFELGPGEQVDDSVDAKLAVARIDASKARPLLRIRVASGEYTAVSARARRGKRVVEEAATAGYAPGKRSLKLPLSASLAGKRVSVEVSAEDGEGNLRTFKRKLRLPPAG